MKNTNKKTLEFNLGWDKNTVPAKPKPALKDFMARQIAIQPSKKTIKK